MTRGALGRGRQAPRPEPCVAPSSGRQPHRRRGYHHAPAGRTVEIEALWTPASAGARRHALRDPEPCNHHGRTPPCTDAIVASGVKRVVFGVRDPNPRVRGGGAARLRRRGLTVEGGVAADACAELHAGFLTVARLGRPLVTLKLAATLDGRIATRRGDSRWITGPAARRYVHRLRSGTTRSWSAPAP
jgi:diaminohydroxyphosphoribosylaminopyrimidine deaminase/5-amino-6-(5-phosphoribosylamino)uracil reductase